MTKIRLAAALLAAGVLTTTSAVADDDHDRDRDGPLTLAVFGDWPYSDILLNSAKLLVDSVNADRKVDLVMHVGDIHSGNQPCTSAGILPPIPASNPGWNQAVYFQFQQLNAPVVYTPGDNEWADCHKTKEKASGQPLKELASVRSLFFARPGHTLGRTDKEVTSQAQHFDPAFPSDAQFVENVMWQDNRVMFVTLNMPGGSNNDTAAWTNGFEDVAAHMDEVAQRNAADIRWLEAAFKRALATHARPWSSACRPICGTLKPRRRAVPASTSTRRSCSGSPTSASRSAVRCCCSTATRICTRRIIRSPTRRAPPGRSTTPSRCRT
jgi:hypothetical protein